MILLLYNSSINKKLVLGGLYFGSMASKWPDFVLPTKIVPNKHTAERYIIYIGIWIGANNWVNVGTVQGTVLCSRPPSPHFGDDMLLICDSSVSLYRRILQHLSGGICSQGLQSGL